MRAKHLPFKILATNACTTNTGDGHKMGQAVGADLSYMDSCWGAPAILTTGQDPKELIANNEIAQEIAGTDWAMYRGLPGAVVVNRKGHRIGNEATAYDTYNKAFAYYDNGEMEHLNIPSYFICDSACWNTYSLPGHTVGSMDGGYFDETYGSDGSDGELPAHFVQADTLEELAEKLKLPVDTLVATVERNNENYDNQSDPDFGKEPFRLSALRNPPFYGVYNTGTLLCTLDGIVINSEGQALRDDGSAIEGLYVAGNDSGGFYSMTYPNLTTGNACGRTVTFARMIAQKLASS